MFYASLFDVLKAPLGWLMASGENALISLVLFVFGWMIKKYLLPYIKTETQKKMAEWILRIADDVTDQLVAKYPDKELWEFIDKAIDKVMEICGVSKEVATRAVEASLSRKGLRNNARGRE